MLILDQDLDTYLLMVYVALGMRCLLLTAIMIGTHLTVVIEKMPQSCVKVLTHYSYIIGTYIHV